CQVYDSSANILF
nr:immunoglobulin light chain junction region [Macaca mulatta]MPO08422.1 immunoglobulin light chain junction region [Macaca mulatta]MPO08890.1 immunoglobulin light chain junction region [Macaca mulatta]MPO09338.1 immunoglobulin light chain junction region [Macaca mulatta]MPO10075.1 immunoglobulin light chain junction region [Macaca mulatta]